MEESKEIYNLLRYISEVSVIFPISAGLFRFVRLNAGLRILVFYVFLSGCVDVLSDIIIQYFKHSNTELLRGFTLLEFVLLTLYFRTLFNSKIAKRLLLAAILSFGIIDIICTQFLQPGDAFDSYASAIESLFMVFFPLCYFYKIFAEAVIEKLEKEPSFWIVTAILIYFAGTLFLFLCSDIALTSMKEYFLKYWSINFILNIIFNILLTAGLWITPPKLNLL
jgi:hypothetical protein